MQLCIQRVTKVVHRAPDDVMLLAASSWLVKIARRFDLGMGLITES